MFQELGTHLIDVLQYKFLCLQDKFYWLLYKTCGGYRRNAYFFIWIQYLNCFGKRGTTREILCLSKQRTFETFLAQNPLMDGNGIAINLLGDVHLLRTNTLDDFRGHIDLFMRNFLSLHLYFLTLSTVTEFHTMFISSNVYCRFLFACCNPMPNRFRPFLGCLCLTFILFFIS
jgi:hypothetical protein